MKIIGIIPSRYASTRLPGKPLKEISGKPMIWWVYKHTKESKKLDDVFVATDDDRISNYCKSVDIKCVMTGEHDNHISRIHEVSTIIDADIYVSVNGDEPLIGGDTIDSAIANDMIIDKPCFYGSVRKLTNPAEVMDPTNIKIATNRNNRCVYISRAPIPFPYGTTSFFYKKYVGIECFNKLALQAYVDTKKEELEFVEDIDHLRFLEIGVPMYFNEIESDSISVDTQKDLEYVRFIMSKKKIESMTSKTQL